MTPEEIAALKAGDKITVEVEEVGRDNARGATVAFAGGNFYYLSPSVLAHATLTKAPPRPLEVGEPVMWNGWRWTVVAPPLEGELVLSRDDTGYRIVPASSCARVQP